ncbi:MAG: replication/maintenance protein RepL [Bacteroidales bacterium]
MAKINQSVETLVIDQNGEFVSKRANRTLSWGDEPPYVKMYLDSLLYLKDMPKGYNVVLNALLKRMSYAGDADGQVIVVNKAVKERISKELGISVSRIDNVMGDLTKGELLYRIDRGMYRVNPSFFGKGDWQDIARLRLEITFDANGKTIMGEIEKKSKKNEVDPNQMTLALTGTDG